MNVFLVIMRLTCLVIVWVTQAAAQSSCPSQVNCDAVGVSEPRSLALVQGHHVRKRIISPTVPEEEEEDEEEITFNVTCTCERLPGDTTEDDFSFGKCVTEDGDSYYLFDDLGPVDDILPGATVEVELVEVSGEDFDLHGAFPENEKVYRVITFTQLDVEDELLQVQGANDGAISNMMQGNRYVAVGWTSRCPSGTMTIQTASECRTAAGYIGKPWGWEGNWRRAGPACQNGCGDKIYFNHHRNSPGAKLICKRVIPCSANAPANCASCTVPNGDACEQCNDGVTMQSDGSCQATCADLTCPRGYVMKNGAGPLLNPDIARCCEDTSRGIVQAAFAATQCPSGTVSLNEAECEEQATLGSSVMKSRRGDAISHPRPFKVTQPGWIVWKRCPNGCIFRQTGRKYYFTDNPNPPSTGYRDCSLVCRAPTEAPTPAPTFMPLPTTQAPQSHDWRNVLMNKHNSLRASEGSSSMPRLLWDPTLEASSQRWADKCTFSHSPDDAGNYNDCASNACGQQNGENLWMGSGSSPDLEQAVADWYNEKSHYNFNNGTFQSGNCAHDEVCGHYTQVVSAMTLKIGCALKTDCTGQWKSYIVCQYDPPGNVAGDTLYKKGTACSECPVGYNCCEGDLCVGTPPVALTGDFSWDKTCGGSVQNYTLNTCVDNRTFTMIAKERTWVAKLTKYSDNSCTGQGIEYVPQEIGICDSKLGFDSKFTYNGPNTIATAPNPLTNGVCSDSGPIASSSTPMPTTLATTPEPVTPAPTQLPTPAPTTEPATPAPTQPSTPAPTSSPEQPNWVLVFRQTMPHLYHRGEWAKNEADPTNANYAILDRLESCRANDGKFTLKLSWPANGKQDQIWRQTSNPVDRTSGGVEGYEPISTPYNGHNWFGLENDNENTLLDGSRGNNWWFAVGTFRKHRNQIPGPDDVVSETELYADCETPPPPPPTTTPFPANWVLVFRQTMPHLYHREEWTKNEADPTNANYAILDRLESCRSDAGKFTLKLSWPANGKQDQIWRQTSNPVERTSGGVEGYEPISTPYNGHNWFGLENNNENTLLDGSRGNNWWFAVGTFRKHRNQIPGPDTVVEKVELYVDCVLPPSETCNEGLSGTGADYRGCQTTTRSGLTCQRWDSQSPHRHDRTPQKYPQSGLESNFCRNPDGEPTIWCYTNSNNKRWEFCDVFAPPPSSTGTCDEGLSGTGADYRGCQTKTRSGLTCQRWDSQSPHRHDRTPQKYPQSGLESNFCRNPDGEPTIWCYTTSDRKRWEYCDTLAAL